MNPGKGEQPGAAKRNGVGTELKLNCFLNDHELLTRHQFVKLFTVAVGIENRFVSFWVDLAIDDLCAVLENNNEPVAHTVIVQRSNVAAINSGHAVHGLLL